MKNLAANPSILALRAALGDGLGVLDDGTRVVLLGEADSVLDIRVLRWTKVDAISQSQVRVRHGEFFFFFLNLAGKPVK